MQKAVLGAAIAALMTLGAVASGWAQTPLSPGEAVDEYTRLANAYDDAITDLLADDVVIVIGPCMQAFGPDGCVGKAQATQVLGGTFDVHAQVTVLDQSESGSSVTQRREIASDVISGAGVDRIIEDATFDVVDGKIASLHAVPDGSDAQTAQFLAAMQMRPPATGDAGLADRDTGSSSSLLPWVTGGLLLATVAGAAVVARGRHAAGWIR
jgi:hypothetical protein